MMKWNLGVSWPRWPSRHAKINSSKAIENTSAIASQRSLSRFKLPFFNTRKPTPVNQSVKENVSDYELIERSEQITVVDRIESRKNAASHADYMKLMQQAESEWVIIHGSQSVEKPVGEYAFVRLPNEDFIRITPLDKSIHLTVSGRAPTVLYAGEVYFNDNGKLVKFNNQSRAYEPPERLCHQAGFSKDYFESYLSKRENHYLSCRGATGSLSL